VLPERGVRTIPARCKNLPTAHRKFRETGAEIPCNLTKNSLLPILGNFDYIHINQFLVVKICSCQFAPDLLIAGNFAYLRGVKGRKRPANARLL
jgi:hypothetical protein